MRRGYRYRHTRTGYREKRQCRRWCEPNFVNNNALRTGTGGECRQPRGSALATIVTHDDWHLWPLARNTRAEARHICSAKIDIDSAANSVGAETQRQDQRLVYCGALRAFFKPYFLLSFLRESRVRRPALRNTVRFSGSSSTMERAIAMRSAPA